MSAGGRWSSEKIVKFLEMYRKQECLWNPKLKDYRNRTIREHAIEQIIIHMEDPDLSPLQVKDKIRSLRTTFCSEVNKINRMRKEGYDYKPRLSWFSNLEFLLHDKSDDDDEDSLKINHLPSDYNQMKTETYEEEASRHSPTPEPRKRKHTQHNKIDVLQTPKPCFVATNDLEPSYREEDEFEVFSRNVTLQLQRLPLKYALEAQEQIQRVLKEQRIKALDENSD